MSSTHGGSAPHPLRFEKVFWFHGETEPGRDLSHLSPECEIQVARFDRASLLAASAANAVVIADLTRVPGPLGETVRLFEQLSLSPICIVKPERVAEVRDHVNSRAIQHLLIAPVSDAHLAVALRALAQRPAPAIDPLAAAVQASIGALGDLLALAMPEAFGKGQRIARYAVALAEEVGFDPTWRLVAAAILSQVGVVSLPPEVVSKLYRGQPLAEEERLAVDLLPVIAEEITRGAPSLEGVRRLIRGAFGSESSLPVAPVEVQILRLARAFESARATESLSWGVIDAQLGESEYWAPLQEALRHMAERERALDIVQIPLRELKDGMVLAEDVYDNSVLLLARGHCVRGRVTFRLRALGMGRGKGRTLGVIRSRED